MFVHVSRSAPPVQARCCRSSR